MSGFEPGEGWRPIAEEDIRLNDEVISHARQFGADPTWWVRVVPVPPLPTEPYTVIRVVWTDGDVVDMVFRDGSWHVPGRDRSYGNTEGLRARVRRFEVLSEPRAVTAKAVLDRVREALPLGADRFSQDHLTLVAREFGVTS